MSEHGTSLQLLIRAIADRQIVYFQYRGGIRYVEPHVCGEDAHGTLLLTGWQARGATHSLPHVGWRTFRVTEMLDLQSSPERFAGTRPGYNREDPRMTLIHAALP
jgi:hypothetical protein